MTDRLIVVWPYVMIVCGGAGLVLIALQAAGVTS